MMYKGFSIGNPVGNPGRFAAVILGKNAALMGAGIGTDSKGALRAAKTKIDNMSRRDRRFAN